jgi:hypothetical protein
LSCNPGRVCRVLPPSPATTRTSQRETKEIVMFTVTSRKTQTAVCMILSAVIVSVSLSLGALMAESAAHDGYSVTITQIQ